MLELLLIYSSLINCLKQVNSNKPLVVLTQPESVMNNSKKLEQFLATRIERKLNELEIQSLINSKLYFVIIEKLKELFVRINTRITYLNQLKT